MITKQQYDDEHDHTRNEETVPVAVSSRGTPRTATSARNAAGTVAPRAMAMNRTCSSWEPPDPPGWEGGFARNH